MIDLGSKAHIDKLYKDSKQATKTIYRAKRTKSFIVIPEKLCKAPVYALSSLILSVSQIITEIDSYMLVIY